MLILEVWALARRGALENGYFFSTYYLEFVRLLFGNLLKTVLTIISLADHLL